MKKIYVVHRWEGSPSADWYPWLKSKLENDFEVEILELPTPENPRIDAWVQKLNESINADEDVYLVGHSVGCQTIIRYLEKLNGKIGGAIFVGGWFTLSEESIEDEEDAKIAKPWLEEKIDFEKVKESLPKSTAIFSDNDPYVPLSNKEDFESKLGSKIIVQEKSGHFTEPDFKELPVVYEEIIGLTKSL